MTLNSLFTDGRFKQNLILFAIVEITIKLFLELKMFRSVKVRYLVGPESSKLALGIESTFQ